MVLNTVTKDQKSLQIDPNGVSRGLARNVIPDVITCLGTSVQKTVPNFNCLNSSIDDEKEVQDDVESDSKELDLLENYKALYYDWVKWVDRIKCLVKMNERLTKKNDDQKDSVARLEVMLTKKDVEHEKVKRELEKTSESLSKWNLGKTKLSEILSIGQEDSTGLGYKPTVFVKAGEGTSSPSHNKRSHVNKSRVRKRRYICHYCFTHGHIRPFCHKMKADLSKKHYGNQVCSRMSPYLNQPV